MGRTATLAGRSWLIVALAGTFSHFLAVGPQQETTPIGDDDLLHTTAMIRRMSVG